MFSLLRFAKSKDPFAYQSSVRSGIERDTFSHNIFSVSFGKHFVAYKYYVEAQDYLSKESRDTKILLQALRHLPRLKDVTVVFQNRGIGAREIMPAFGLLNGNEVTLDSEYTLPILLKALIESGRELQTFKLVHSQSTSVGLFCQSRRDFNYSHEPRFKYVSENPKNVTAKALWNAFHDDDGTIRMKVISLMGRLREFNMAGMEIESTDSIGFIQLVTALEPMVAFSRQLEELDICPYVTGTLRGNRLCLSSILHESVCFSGLKRLRLDHVESPESLLVELFTQNSNSLVDVALYSVRITDSGKWSDVFRKARNAEFKVLYNFLPFYGGEAEDVLPTVVSTENYLKRLTDRCPTAEYSEN